MTDADVRRGPHFAALLMTFLLHPDAPDDRRPATSTSPGRRLLPSDARGKRVYVF